ncbi:HAMP domain-containing sensor histidine kinase [Actinomyces viscosus]|uniref:sensor histidine kinase n=1 Tax=Actinomyces viscosus TaxID=1656 RepID=UPI0028E34857|nr:HAMP domain-containing sensor histidine kinase [Actinomyces viscosus]
MTSLMPTRTVTIGTRVMWAIVLVASIALITCGAIVWALGHSSVSADATNRLEHSRDRIRQLAADRVDPSSGQPLEDVSSVLRAHIQRTAEGPGEAELGFVGTSSDTELTWVSSDNVSFRPEEDPELLKQVTSQAAASESVIETVRTSSSSYRVLIVPVQDGSQRGALVHVIDLKVAESQLQRTMAFYAAAAVFTVALVTGLAWFAVERLLRPIEQLRRATESIGEDDLTTRVPVKGRDDLTALAAAVNRMLDRVQTSVEAQRNLLDDVGHELRTPIAVVRGHLELTDPGDPEDVRQTQLLAIDELDRMGMLVDDLILLAKSAQSDFTTPVDTDVAELTELVFDKSLALGERRWQLESAAFTRARIDPTRITQAWLQLVANAVKYSEHCSTVSLGSAVRDGHLLMWVGDEGIGIAPEEIDLVRQRFKRTSSAQELASGTGLGLSIVETIVAAHGGELDIRSQVGVGSVLTMRIPLTAPGPAPSVSPAPHPTQGTRTHSRSDPP